MSGLRRNARSVVLRGALLAGVVGAEVAGWHKIALAVALVAVLYEARAQRRPIGSGPLPLHEELSRARRFGRPFALLAFEVEGDSVQALEVLDRARRSIDDVWTVEGWTYVLLPELARDAADAAHHRLQQELTDAAVAYRSGLAMFPEDAVTSTALMTAAQASAALLPTVVDLRTEAEPEQASTHLGIVS